MRALIAAALAAPVLILPTAQPAHASGCTSSGGVEVVVEYDALGPSDAVDCAPGKGGETAASLFEATGHHQEQVQRFPGAVCRVDALPSGVSCYDMPPADHYWALFWSDGRNGWVYSQLGAYSLKVPEGGKVAWVWQNDNGRNTPSQSSRRTGSAPSASPSVPDVESPGGAHGDDGAPDGQDTQPAGPSSAAPTSSSPEPETRGATPRTSRRNESVDQGRAAGEARQARREQQAERVGRRRSADGTPSVSTDGDRAVADPPPGAIEPVGADPSSGLPLAVVVGVLVLLAVAAGGAAWWRRTRSR